ncbi:MAG TPA: DUF4857 domain-containing protein [Prolixibacteraceae bacterium]|jgi:hypothetical protein|nr:DUF4857 domain-containing protein [Prolixibacteraceae bacterium]
MMVRISRYILVLVAVMAAAATLTQLYWMVFEKPVRAPFIMYSCVDDDFMIQRSGEPIVREDTRGNQYTREEYEEKLPLLYMRQLMLSGTMLDTIRGIAMDAHDINMARSFFRYTPTDRYTPDPGLYPLLESESGRANLELPGDFFRITWRMEFTDAKSNKVDEEKSQLFSAALYHFGFQFPATRIAGLPTTRKSCDEGYLITDAAEQLFHVKMVKGKPYVQKVELPDGLQFEHIACVDFRDKLYYAYLFDKAGEVWILTQDDYQMVKLPAGAFRPGSEDLRIYGDLFNYHVIVNGEGFIRVTVLDREFNKVDEYQETWKPRMEQPEGKAFTWLFPGELKISSEHSDFLQFRYEANPVWRWIWLSVALVLVHFLVIRWRNRKPGSGSSVWDSEGRAAMDNGEPVPVIGSAQEARGSSELPEERKRSLLRRHGLDLIIVLLTGIFGFIAIQIFPNRFFD